jgi:hypothetical protein
MKHGGGGAAAIWVLLLLLVLIVIKASFLPKVSPCKSPSFSIYTSLHFHVDVFLSTIVHTICRDFTSQSNYKTQVI